MDNLLTIIENADKHLDNACPAQTHITPRETRNFCHLDQEGNLNRKQGKLVLVRALKTHRFTTTYVGIVQNISHHPRLTIQNL